MRKLKLLVALSTIASLLVLTGCSNQIEEDAKKVAKFKCETDALTAKMTSDPSNIAAVQPELTKLAAQEGAMIELTKKYRDNSSPADQEKFKQAMLKAIGEGCAK